MVTPAAVGVETPAAVGVVSPAAVGVVTPHTHSNLVGVVVHLRLD